LLSLVEVQQVPYQQEGSGWKEQGGCVHVLNPPLNGVVAVSPNPFVFSITSQVIVNQLGCDPML
jgi:hypothetical protein